MGILIEAEGINRTENHRTGSSGVYETWCDSISDLFLAMQREHGRCISKVYIGEGIQIGWVFEKRLKYDDCKDTFLMHTWISLHKSKPVKSITYDYLEM